PIFKASFTANYFKYASAFSTFMLCIQNNFSDTLAFVLGFYNRIINHLELYLEKVGKLSSHALNFSYL
ncbi:hypothetical protein ACYT7O_10890, partial [Streptococcus pyogenes]